MLWRISGEIEAQPWTITGWYDYDDDEVQTEIGRYYYYGDMIIANAFAVLRPLLR